MNIIPYICTIKLKQINMATFKFYQDVKVISWDRTHFEVEANSYEDAVEKLAIAKNTDIWEDNISLEAGIDGDSMNTDDDVMIENKEPYPFDGTEATIEMFNENGYKIYSNLD